MIKLGHPIPQQKWEQLSASKNQLNDSSVSKPQSTKKRIVFHCKSGSNIEWTFHNLKAIIDFDSDSRFNEDYEFGDSFYYKVEVDCNK